ncbi:UDP-galactopyranose mutase [Roseibium sp. SCP14]|uniref:UDP-galactopyranose mutase n=1 Tax=Roseibium sp. SCP14 TaxID=3141375 RepID=UPI0033382247
MSRVCIVGAGFSGAVIGRELAQKGRKILVVDERRHVAGNCHTERDDATGIMVHRYGPHIFHTDDEEVWRYISQFGEMMPYVNRVKATVKGRVYSLPINLHTINQFFEASFSPDEAREFVRSQSRVDIYDPQTFEQQGLKFVGEALYYAFFDGYTRKQWGVEPKKLPASILKRLPVRFNYNDNYFSHRFQGIPRKGYSAVVEEILDHDNIELKLNCRFEDLSEAFQHIFYSGPLDRYFNFDLGRLQYRTLQFEEIRQKGDIQGTAVMNYPDQEIPYTRISEHKYFSPWETDKFSHSVAYREYSSSCGPDDIPYYPIRLVGDKNKFEEYKERTKDISGITFVGRLGTYQYLDMDATIRAALDTAQQFLESVDE